MYREYVGRVSYFQTVDFCWVWVLWPLLNPQDCHHSSQRGLPHISCFSLFCENICLKFLQQILKIQESLMVGLSIMTYNLGLPIPGEDWVALTTQSTWMYLLELTFLKVETEAMTMVKWSFANNESENFWDIIKSMPFFQQIHQREKTWKMMVYASPSILLGLLLMLWSLLTDVCVRNNKKWSQSLNQSLLFFPPTEEMPIFSFKMWVYMLEKEKQGLATVIRRQQQSFFFFAPLHQL